MWVEKDSSAAQKNLTLILSKHMVGTQMSSYVWNGCKWGFFVPLDFATNIISLMDSHDEDDHFIDAQYGMGHEIVCLARYKGLKVVY